MSAAQKSLLEQVRAAEKDLDEMTIKNAQLICKLEVRLPTAAAQCTCTCMYMRITFLTYNLVVALKKRMIVYVGS